ncbi:MAG: hypothetical protein H6741_33845 [Alphaproteobacteria bacterium]|nr:hypothetical protein [Alphaproteobacteria bacterium]
MRPLILAALMTPLLWLGGCDSSECEVGAYQCTEGEILEECTDEGWTVAEDCTESGLMCHAEMGHCMDM